MNDTTHPNVTFAYAGMVEENHSGDMPAATVTNASQTEALAEKNDEAETSSGVERIALDTPRVINGRMVAEIVLDFTRLTGADYPNIEAELDAAERTPVIKNVMMSSTYCMYIAARAVGVNVNDIKRLSFRDTTRIINRTRNFLIASA